ncbi:MAG TPA: MarR family winged helix-turn-helix transcriptional regulator [Polyangiaceae bacterium]|nr:MarR family winged helix-turn-helix transcriptional regulator [Polyangiaceae bacterium]
MTSNGQPESPEGRALQAIEVLGRLAAVFTERRRQLAESVGLTDQQWQALEEIQSEHFMPSLFARERKSSAAAVSKILRQLTDKGLITSSVRGDDGRKREYEITGPGLRALGTLRAERQRAIEHVWLSLSPAHLTDWTTVGSELAERLETYAARGEELTSAERDAPNRDQTSRDQTNRDHQTSPAQQSAE